VHGRVELAAEAAPYGIMVSNPLPRIEHAESKDTLTSKHTEDTRHATWAYSLTPLLGVRG